MGRTFQRTRPTDPLLPGGETLTEIDRLLEDIPDDGSTLDQERLDGIESLLEGDDELRELLSDVDWRAINKVSHASSHASCPISCHASSHALCRISCHASYRTSYYTYYSLRGGVGWGGGGGTRGEARGGMKCSFSPSHFAPPPTRHRYAGFTYNHASYSYKEDTSFVTRDRKVSHTSSHASCHISCLASCRYRCSKTLKFLYFEKRVLPSSCWGKTKWPPCKSLVVEFRRK